MMATWWWRRQRLVPPTLAEHLERDERVQAAAPCANGTVLAVSRFGLWVINDGSTPERLGWDLISRARLSARTLSVTLAQVVARWDDGTVVLRDLPTLEFELSLGSSLTDVVHTRVRRSVAASRYLEWPGGGGWVVLRRVPGQDGLTRQVRLDRGVDVEEPGFAQAVALVADELATETQG